MWLIICLVALISVNPKKAICGVICRSTIMFPNYCVSLFHKILVFMWKRDEQELLFQTFKKSKEVAKRC